MLVSREKPRFDRVLHDWLLLLTARSWSQVVAERFALRKEVRKRTNRLMRLLFVCLWSVGKFVRHSRIRRHEKMMRFMKRIVCAKKGLWKLRRRIRMKHFVARFVGTYETVPTLLIFMKFVVSRIVLVQKWYRRYHVKRLLMLSLMNIQWSAIEFVVLRSRLGKDGSDTTMTAQEINASIREGRVSSAVPVPVRLRLLKDQLNV